MLRVERLNAYYGRSHVVVDVSFHVDEGEIVALLGRNGAGKTTTMAALMGFVRAGSRTLELNGTRIDQLRTHARVRSGLGYVPQSGRVFSGLTVRENLDIVRGRRTSNGWSPERAFEAFPALRGLAGRDAGFLSGGERQMLAVARALMANPSVVLLDEPSEGLAPVVVQRLSELIKQLKEQGIGVLVTEQNHRYALAMADRGYLMEKGRLRHEAPAAELVDSEELHRYLGV
ncbi:ABC transporter ATP-binding protein [soil metagenome]